MLVSANADFLTLLRDETMHMLMLMASPEGIVVINQDREVILFTGRAEELFGYAPVEIYGKPPELLFNSTAEYANLQAKLASDMTISNYKLSAMTVAGVTFPVQVSASILVDRIGEQAPIVLYVRDYTDVQSIEDSLRTNNTKLNALVDELGHVASLTS